jgi:hypothetical protein
MRRWSGRGHRPSATNALVWGSWGRGVLRRRSRLLCRGGRSRLGNFRFARDLGMRFQSLTTVVRSAMRRWGTKWQLLYVSPLFSLIVRNGLVFGKYERNSRALPLDKY